MTTSFVPHPTLGLVFAVSSAFGFSFKAIFVKLGLLAGGDAITLLALRMVFSLPIFLWMALRAGASSLGRQEWAGLAILGLLGYYLSSLFDFLGLQYISAGLERLILFMYPTLVLLLSALWLGQPLTRRALFALALCYAGIGLAVGHDLDVTGDHERLWLGSAWVFASTVTYALYLMGCGRIIPRVGAARFTAFASTFACLFCLGHFAATRPLSALIVSQDIYLIGMGLAVVSTVLPIYFQAQAMRHLGASKVAMVGTLGPVLTIGLAGWLLDEAMSLQQLLGTLLVIAGVTVSSRR